jgi:hypothetical protein
VNAANSSGATYRREAALWIDGKSNAKIANLEIKGVFAGGEGPISIRNATAATVEHVALRGTRTVGIPVWTSVGTRIADLALTMQRSTGGEPEGGAGIWLYECRDSVVEHSVIDGKTYWDAGPPSNSGDPRATPLSAPTMDLVAAYRGNNNRFQHNTITSGNTAAIYLATYQGAHENNALIWDNDIHHFRQHGLDIEGVEAPQILANVVHDVELAALGMADCRNGLVQWNSFWQAGTYLGSYPAMGTITLLWGSRFNRFWNNIVVGGPAPYAVAFRNLTTAYPTPHGNVFGTTASCTNTTPLQGSTGLCDNQWSPGTQGWWLDDSPGSNTIGTNTQI